MHKRKNKVKYINKKPSVIYLFFRKIIRFFTHRIYFMFIPHSKKKTKTLSIPVYALIFIVLIIILLLDEGI